MVIRAFPPVEYANDFGLLAVGGDLDVESLLLAYRSGIFPWPFPDLEEIPWFAPPRRAVLFFDELRLPRRLQRTYRNSPWRFAIDTAFEEVIRGCGESRNRAAGEGTWIREDIINAFLRLHRAGWAHSIECFDGNELIGGLYGIAIGTMFAGESMFYRTSNASKLCLCFLIEHLRSKGGTWLDCQQLTPLLERLGARELPRIEFMKLLEEAVAQKTSLF